MPSFVWQTLQGFWGFTLPGVGGLGKLERLPLIRTSSSVLSHPQKAHSQAQMTDSRKYKNSEAGVVTGFGEYQGIACCHLRERKKKISLSTSWSTVLWLDELVLLIHSTYVGVVFRQHLLSPGDDSLAAVHDGMLCVAMTS